jgi:uncharacterized membrane protein
VYSLGLVLMLAFGIGFVGGLRSFTAPAVVAWAAHIGLLNLSHSRLAFMGSLWAVAILTLGALGEYVADKLPSAPARTTVGSLLFRAVGGLLTGACLGIAGGGSPWATAFAGAIGAIAGAFAGYHARVWLVRSLNVRDFMVAIPEDLLAIGLGLFFVTRF